MKETIRTWGWKAEFLVVTLFAFGPFIGKSLWVAFHQEVARITATRLLLMIVHEIAVTGILFLFLRLRGLDVRGLAKWPSGGDLIRGGGLALGVWISYTALWITSALLVPGSTQGLRGAYQVDGHLGLAIVCLVSLVNPIFEEMFVCGYVLSALKGKLDVNAAVAISVVIRVVYHLYQGPIALLSVIPTGAIFALWYVRSQRLMPVILAHMVLDFLALLAYL